MNKLMVCAIDAVPATAAGLVVYLLSGGQPVVAVLAAGGAAFTCHAAVQACLGAIFDTARVYHADAWEVKPTKRH